MMSAIVLQVLGLLALSHAIRPQRELEMALLIPYGGAAIGLGLWAFDFFLDL